MKKIFELILSNIKEAMSKFVVSFCGSVIAFILLTLQIIFDFTENTVVLMAFGGFCRYSVGNDADYKHKVQFFQKADIIQRIVSALTAVPCYFLIGNIMESDRTFMGFFGLIIAFLLISLYVMYDNENSDLVFPQIIKSAFFAVTVASLFFGGITLCILALDFLVVELQQFDKWITITALLSYIILCYNLFIAMLPEKTDEIVLPKIFKVLVLYVGLPVYTLLLGVLYAYLIKILVIMEMPQGKINLFASLASLFFIFFYLTVGSYDNAPVRFFRKYGGWFLFPIIASQAIAIYKGNAYGLTSARWASILLNVTALVFIILTLIKEGKYTKHVITGLAVIVLISSLTPLNIIDVPVYEQTYRLEKVLKRNNMLADGTVKPYKDISKTDKEIISSCYDYLNYKDKAPGYIKESNSFYDIFGFEKLNEYGSLDEYSLIHLNKSNSYNALDISGYSRYYIVDTSRERELKIVIDNTEYNVAEQIMKIKEGNDRSDMIFDVTEDIRVYLTYVYYEMNNEGEVLYFSATGFALGK